MIDDWSSVGAPVPDDWSDVGTIAPASTDWSDVGAPASPQAQTKSWRDLPMMQTDEGNWRQTASPPPPPGLVPATVSLTPGGQTQQIVMRSPAPPDQQGAWQARANAFPRGIVQGAGSAIAGIGQVVAGEDVQSQYRRQLGVLDAMDAGKVLAPSQDIDDMQSKSPEERQQYRAWLNDRINSGGRPLSQQIGQAITGAGQSVSQYGGQQVPVAPENERDLGVMVSGGLGAFVPLLAAGASPLGLPAAALTAGAQSYDSTYQSALQANPQRPDLAHSAATLSGLVGAGAMAIPVARFLANTERATGVPLAQAALRSVSEGTVLTGIDQAQRFANNLIAANTYDPSRSALEGLGDVRDMAASGLTGALLPVAGHVPDAIRSAMRPGFDPALRIGAEGMTSDAAAANATRPVTSDDVTDTRPATDATTAGQPANANDANPNASRPESPLYGVPDAPDVGKDATPVDGGNDNLPQGQPRDVSFPNSPDTGDASATSNAPSNDNWSDVGSPVEQDEPATPSSAPITGKTFEDRAGGVVSRLMSDLNLTRDQASGVVGNLGHESRLEAINERNPTVAGSRGGFGWGQWTGERRTDFEAFAKDRGLSVTDPEANYQFLVHELTGKESGALGKLRATDTLDAATKSFTENYERPGIVAMGSRLQFARKALGAADSVGDQAQTINQVHAGNMSIDTTPMVMELSDLIASHGSDGKVNPDYPHDDGLQPRDRTTVGSQDQVRDIASNLKPSLLMPAPDASGGAPIVGPDGRVVENGNGRVAALSLAYNDPALSEQGQNYRNYLAAQGYDVGGMKQPVLVSKRLTPLDASSLQQFVKNTADRNTLAMNPAERAQADSKVAGSAIDLWNGASASAAANAPFVRSFMQGIPPSERGGMIGTDGQLNAAGDKRIQGAVVAHAYGDQLGPTLDRFINNDAEGLKTIAGGMTDAAGTWAQMRSEASRGMIAPNADITPDLAHAVQIVDSARQNGKPVADLLAQSDLDRPVSPMTADLVRGFFRDDAMTKPAGREAVSERLKGYAQEALKTQAGKDMFGQSAPAPADLMRTAVQRSLRGGPKYAARDEAQAHTETMADGDARTLTPQAIAARDRLRTSAQAMMRFFGLPEDVGLRMVNKIVAGAHGADGSYTRGLIEMALDTSPDLLPQKLFHESVHALMDPSLGLLTEPQRKTLLSAADAWLGKGNNREKIAALYGDDPALQREEAIARMGEAAFKNGMRGDGPAGRVYGRMLNAVRGLGQVLRGQGYTTAEDVFRGVLRGDRAGAGSREALLASGFNAALPGAYQAPARIRDDQQQTAAPPSEAGGSSAIREFGPSPDRYLSKRDAPLLSDKAGLERAGQLTLDGTGRNEAVANQRRADAPLLSKTAQKTAEDLPLFSQDRKQASLFSLRQNLSTALRDGSEEPRRALNAMLNQALFPMRAGSEAAQVVATKFASALRIIIFRYGKIDEQLRHEYTPDQRASMGKALDAESVFAQRVRNNEFSDPATARAQFDAGKTGLAGLDAKSRRDVEDLSKLAQQTWQRLVDRNLVVPGADGLPHYMPRQFVMMEGLTGARRITADDNQLGKAGKGGKSGGGSGGGGLTAMDRVGGNLTTSGPKERLHLDAADSEAAAKAKFGDNATLVTDIRSLVDALKRQEQAIAGRDLVNSIKTLGEASGVDFVKEGAAPAKGFFTLDHPSLWSVGPTGEVDANGKSVFGRMPLHIDEQFRGPLGAVLSKPNPDWYRALIAVKNRSMGLIMFSPFMHLSVEVGRSLPVYGMRVDKLISSMQRAKNVIGDRAAMDRAISDGIAPISQNWKNFDAAAILNDSVSMPSQSVYQKLLAGDTRVQRAWADVHHKLLWNQVFKLQMGIYSDMRSKYMGMGFTPSASGIMAAHLANRYAGALPPEHLSKAANIASNVALFSRSFTLGNLAVMKDMFNGAPAHVQAALRAELGGEGADKAINTLKRKARSAFMMDIATFYGMNALAQSAFGAIRNTANGDGFSDVASKAWQDYVDHILPQFGNEPGKEDRSFIGRDSGGTGVYARLAMGKVPEELMGWMPVIGHPGTMIQAKLNPMLRSTWEAVTGRDSLGRAIYNPSPQGISDHLKMAGEAVMHIAASLGPTDFVSSLYSTATGQAKGDGVVNAARLLLPFSGLGSISQGYPGGPEEGVKHAEAAHQDYDHMQARVEAKRLYATGQQDKARAVLDQAFAGSPREAMSAWRSIVAPQKAQVRFDRRFLQTASEDAKTRASSVTGRNAP